MPATQHVPATIDDIDVETLSALIGDGLGGGRLTGFETEQIGDVAQVLLAESIAEAARVGPQRDPGDEFHDRPPSPSWRICAASRSAASRACSAAPTRWPSAVRR